MPYQLCDHTADVAVEATGPSLDDVFAAVADGLAECMFDPPYPHAGDRFDLTVEAESLESLLFDYLDELIFQRDVRNVLPVENAAVVEHDASHNRVVASARGIPLEEISAREVKAVTYSEMVIEPREDGWYAYVVFDV